MRPMAGLLLSAGMALCACDASAHVRHAVHASAASASPTAASAVLSAVFVNPTPALNLSPGPALVSEPARSDMSFESSPPRWTVGPSMPAAPGLRARKGVPAFNVPVGAAASLPTSRSAWTVSGDTYDVDFSPHAGVDWTNAGASAEAGGMVSVGVHPPGSGDHAALGLRTAGGAAPGAHGRWFLFAAASGQVVGMNMAPGALAGPQSSMWMTEGGETLISDAQAGLGWRRGMLQASVGYVHREIHGEATPDINDGPRNVSDSMVAFSFSLRP